MKDEDPIEVPALPDMASALTRGLFEIDSEIARQEFVNDTIRHLRPDDRTQVLGYMTAQLFDYADALSSVIKAHPELRAEVEAAIENAKFEKIIGAFDWPTSNDDDSDI